MSETDLAPFRLPEKELLRESGLAWEGRGAGESLPTAGRDRECTVAAVLHVLTLTLTLSS